MNSTGVYSAWPSHTHHLERENIFIFLSISTAP
jgi:hypothetical protein